ncbi:hypothetical protein EPH_0057980 [Eimeria praecox]|uniref:Reverse transcriptase, related n=1 Tax=Eimeria praecox TaxID=51316 RepID=U6GZG8_9EIME|nr:hypothetical protein EPH_0057980 [Eimeria praecox]
MCAETEPNAIPVSPRWAEKLIHKEQGALADDQGPTACRKLSAERPTAAQAPTGNGEEKRNTDNSRDVNVGVSVEDHQSVTNVELPPWWLELVANEGSKMEGMLCNVGAPAVLPVEVVGRSCEALLDTGVSRSFINPPLVEALQLKVWEISDVYVFTIANGAQLRIDRTAKRLTVWWCELPLVRTHLAKRTEDENQVAPKRSPAEQVYDLLARQVAQMTDEEATALLRSPPTRTKQRTKPGKKVPIKALIEQARANTTGLRSPLQGLNMVLALPEVDVSVALRIPEEQQGALCCAIISHANTQAEEALPTPAVDIPHATDDESSPWPMAKLDFTLFDEWMQSPDSQDLPQEIREVLQTRKHVFPDSLPPGLPPK